ncbi:iron ABC transporter permease [Marivivens donghaensis]|uniref:Iron ABC transporter permease n=1 Tax=Marivivens donghaensis TaxID=1699413 RepID=A0ABX0W0Q7_9RHOB|nr:iron ABC transporter permease [Marivivens donghaensis]NIY73668.1 iron ABC transporter permease [Marivivens donghaensis]
MGRLTISFALTAALVVLAALFHMSVGAKAVPLSEVTGAFTAFDPTVMDHQIVRALRLPRAVIAIFAGAALGMAGAMTQGITRNPLAEPGILGVLKGAAFAVFICVGFLGLVSVAWIPLVAAIGAVISGAIVFAIARAAPEGATPVTLVLCGAAILAFLSAVLMAVQLLDETTFQNLRVWASGTLTGAKLETVYWALPWGVVGAVIAVWIAPRVTAMAMGDEAALGLGIDLTKTRAWGFGAVVLLSAAAVSVAGPLEFLGLVVPHMARMIVGADYRAIVPYSALLGALVLLLADIAARTVLAPAEISTGIVLALIGAPVFVGLIRARL